MTTATLYSIVSSCTVHINNHSHHHNSPIFIFIIFDILLTHSHTIMLMSLISIIRNLTFHMITDLMNIYNQSNREISASWLKTIISSFYSANSSNTNKRTNSNILINIIDILMRFLNLIFFLSQIPNNLITITHPLVFLKRTISQ